MRHKRQFQRHAAEQARLADVAPSRVDAPGDGLLVEAPHGAALPRGPVPRIGADLVIMHPPVTVQEPTTGVGAGVDTDLTVLADPEPVAEPAQVQADAPGLASLTFSSSNVRSADLDEALGIVTVLFNSGKSYRYANFTRADMAAWSAARSAGSWFNAQVKNRPDLHPLIVDATPGA